MEVFQNDQDVLADAEGVFEEVGAIATTIDGIDAKQGRSIRPRGGPGAAGEVETKKPPACGPSLDVEVFSLDRVQPAGESVHRIRPSRPFLGRDTGEHVADDQRGWNLAGLASMAREQLSKSLGLVDWGFEFSSGVTHGFQSSVLVDDLPGRAPLFRGGSASASPAGIETRGLRPARDLMATGQEYDGWLGSLIEGLLDQTDPQVPQPRRVKKRSLMAFSDDLRRFGPGVSNALSREQSLEYCARLAAEHYENFSVVTWLTPREYRPAFQSIYAFCRWSDDLGDEVGDRERSLELLSWWRELLRAMYRGETGHPVMVALKETVERYSIPIDPFEQLISAFEQDQVVSEYETFEQLLDYCQRSANPVGHLVLHVAGAHSQENVRLADAICTGLQLANFWQDVVRDLAIGRIYLPREDRIRFGCSVADLRAKVFTPAFRRLMEFEVERTRKLFVQGGDLVRRLPRALAIDVDLFARGGGAILDAIEARGFDVLSGRPSLSRATKVRLIAVAAAAHGMNAVAHKLLQSGRRPGKSALNRDVRDVDHSACSVDVSHAGAEDRG